jgi:hypothetical protein
MASDNGGKKILILAGAGASAHAAYACGNDLSWLVWAEVEHAHPAWGIKPILPESVAYDFELLHDVLQAFGDPALVSSLRQALITALGTVRQGHGAERAWPALLHGLSNVGHKVSVFTLNYDPLLEYVAQLFMGHPKANTRLNTGSDSSDARTIEDTIRRETGIDPSDSRTVHPVRTAETAGGWRQAESCVPVVYLHGCIGWQELEPDDDGYRVELRFEGRGKHSKVVAAPEKCAVLWPGRGKAPAEAPFREAYQALARASGSADAIVIIGCKLQDPALWASLLLTAANRDRLPDVWLVDSAPPEPGKEDEHPTAKLPPGLRETCNEVYDGFNADTAGPLAKRIIERLSRPGGTP